MSRSSRTGGGNNAVAVTALCVGVVALGLGIAALVVATGKGGGGGGQHDSLRLRITNVPDIPETALLVGISFTSATGPVYPTDISQDAFLHFQRSGDVVAMTLELTADGDRKQTGNLLFNIQRTVDVLLLVLDSQHLAKYVSPCHGSFGNRFIFTTGADGYYEYPADAFTSNTVGLLQSTDDNVMLLWPEASGNTFATAWEANRHSIPVFSISYGAPNSTCSTDIASKSLDQRLAGIFRALAPL